MDELAQDVNCYIFADAIAALADIKLKIQDSLNNRDRERLAQDLTCKSEVLLTCTTFREGDTDCRSCHRVILDMLEKTAKLLPDDSIINSLAPRSHPRNDHLNPEKKT